ncbi:MAG: BrnT family toxin [Bryobacteraceae bacterium]
MFTVNGETEFDWDEANRAHIAAHDVTPEEFEEVYFGEKLETANARKGETRTAAVGKTDTGRLLAIVYTTRHDKFGLSPPT